MRRQQGGSLRKGSWACLWFRYKLTGETGSYRYMAPEVFRHEPYNTKACARASPCSHPRTRAQAGKTPSYSGCTAPSARMATQKPFLAGPRRPSLCLDATMQQIQRHVTAL